MKKFCLIILSICVMLLPFPIATNATGGRTVLYLDYGDVKIGDGTVSGYDADGKPVTEPNPCGYTVTQSNRLKALNKGITVDSGTHDIEIKNLNIARNSENDSAFCILDSSSVRLTVSGKNRLASGTYRAGVEISLKASLTIEGGGILYAQSTIEAGIGGGNGHSNGTLTINSGTIYATGGIDGYGTGIGGGSSGSGGTITVNGGNITAVGGEYGAGIGGGMLAGGGTVTINGGTVTATGGGKAAGIGGGFSGNGGTVIINGGSVKAIAGTGADSIGNGSNCKTEFGGIHNSKGNAVTMLTVPLTDFKAVYQNGIENQPITAGHADDENLYFYTDSEYSLATVYMNDGNVKFLRYNSDGYEEVFPYTERCVRIGENLVVPYGEAPTAAEGYTLQIENKSYRLDYNGSCIDSSEIVERGDVNRDGSFDGMDAVLAECVANGMLSERVTALLADANLDGSVDSADVAALADMGIAVSG